MEFFQKAFGFPESSSYNDTRKQLLQYASFEFIPPNTPTKDTTNSSNNHHNDDVAPYPREKCTFHLPDEARRTLSAGTFSFPSVSELRAHVTSLQTTMTTTKTMSSPRHDPNTPKLAVANIIGDARSLHTSSLSSSSPIIIQAASQFNLLEFASPSYTPEEGISIYAYDRTQGPACAMAAAGGTAYRNYLVDVEVFQNFKDEDGKGNDEVRRGQTTHRQLNGLADVESWIVGHVPGYDDEKRPWRARNGYVESSSRALGPISEFLRGAPSRTIDDVTSLVRIGIQRDCTVTDVPAFDKTVTQTYNSAISVGYSILPSTAWEPVARLVLNATYEATLLAGVLEGVRASVHGKTVTPIVYLTKVGGGVFRNKDDWIIAAISRALEKIEEMDLGLGLDVRIVHFGEVDMKYSCLQRGIGSLAWR
mmetsp:Transcript_29987/g.59999  ORF Transcript_29987/g.59999 Transcript_29987/m.59999 type:complete len:421 (+) Transcript_29987:70-1332(+)